MHSSADWFVKTCIGLLVLIAILAVVDVTTTTYEVLPGEYTVVERSPYGPNPVFDSRRYDPDFVLIDETGKQHHCDQDEYEAAVVGNRFKIVKSTSGLVGKVRTHIKFIDTSGRDAE